MVAETGGGRAGGYWENGIRRASMLWFPRCKSDRSWDQWEVRGKGGRDSLILIKYMLDIRHRLSVRTSL